MDTKASKVEPAGPARHRLRTRVLFACKLLVAAGLVTYLVSSGRLDASVLGNTTEPAYLAAALVLLALAAGVLVWRWLVLLRVQRLGIGAWTALRLTWLGYFASLFLPGGAGGDLAKAYEACRHRPYAKTRAISTVFVDRAMGLHTMFTWSALAGILAVVGGANVQQKAIGWLAIGLWCVPTVGIVLLLWRRTTRLAGRLLPRSLREPMRTSLDLYRAWAGTMAGLWLFSLFCNTLAIAPYYCVARALAIDVSVVHMLTVVPLVILFNSLPVSPGGLGVGEAAGCGLFAAFGVPNGGAIVLVVRLGSVVTRLPGALGLLSTRRRPSLPGPAVVEESSVA